MVNIKTITDYLESKYPLSLACEWDKVGLQIGSKNIKTTKVLVCLDVTLDVVEEALSNDVKLIITHHPIIFNPIVTINYDSNDGKIIKKIIEGGISIYSMHTNYDIAKEGMNFSLANQLKLFDVEYLDNSETTDFLGVLGQFENALNFDEFITQVKSRYSLDSMRVVNRKDKIKKVAILAGSGASHISIAKKAGADVLITGDLKHHDALKAKTMGLMVLDCGHFLEANFKEFIYSELLSLGVEVIKAKEKNPFEQI